MEEQPVAVQEEIQTQPAFPENTCQNCGNPEFEPEYQLQLCTDCRRSFSALNLPRWLKLTSAGILVVFLAALAVHCCIPLNLV